MGKNGSEVHWVQAIMLNASWSLIKLPVTLAAVFAHSPNVTFHYCLWRTAQHVQPLDSPCMWLEDHMSTGTLCDNARSHILQQPDSYIYIYVSSNGSVHVTILWTIVSETTQTQTLQNRWVYFIIYYSKKISKQNILYAGMPFKLSNRLRL